MPDLRKIIEEEERLLSEISNPPLETHEWNALGSGDVIFCWVKGEEKWYDVIRNDAGNIIALDSSASKIGNKAIRVPLHFRPNYWHKLEREKAGLI